MKEILDKADWWVHFGKWTERRDAHHELVMMWLYTKRGFGNDNLDLTDNRSKDSGESGEGKKWWESWVHKQEIRWA